MQHLSSVLSLLKAANVSLKLSKCEFVKQEVDYLGHKIRPGKLEMTEEKVKAVAVMKLPTTKKEVRSFLGLAGVYRCFVPRFAKISKPLTDMTRLDLPATIERLPDQAAEAFVELKRRLTHAPTLALPRQDGEFILDTDASKHQVGCCLQQRGENGRLQPIGYWSRMLQGAEVNYSTVEMRHWRLFGVSSY